MSASSPDLKTRLLSVQALRAVAAIAVVWHHCGIGIIRGAPHPHLPVPNPWFDVGASGVDIFFVISGFVIFFIAPELPVQWSGRLAFLKNRAIRIYPIYVVFTMVAAVLFVFRGTRDKLTAKFLLSSFVLFPIQSPLTGSFHPILDQGWTLFYEVGFYLLFSLLLGLTLGWRLVSIAGVLAGLFGLAHAIPNGPEVLAIWSDAILFEFVLGCFLAYFYRRRMLPTGKPALALMLAGFVLLLASTHFGQDWSRFFAWGIPGALIVAGAIGVEVGPRDRGRWFAWLSPLGDASYSLYLSHTVITLAEGSLAKKNLFGVSPAKQMMAVVVTMVMCILLGFLVHYRLEIPLMRFFKGKRKPPLSVVLESAVDPEAEKVAAT